VPGTVGSEDTFDAVVVGSGFGGSVMAYRLAKGGQHVCLLERGKPWPPGAFPRTPYQFSQALWDPAEGRHGLYDVWFFRRLGALVSSGLGGGSLIYANVILEKPGDWFTETGRNGTRDPWPISFRDLEPHYDEVRRIIDPVPYPDHYRDTRKTRAFYDAAAKAGLDPFYPPLAVTFADSKAATGTEFGNPQQNLHGLQRYTCRLVGECDVGCNFGSKNSLDFTYLSKAKLEHGLEIRCLNEVKAFERSEGGFRILVADHSESAADGARPGLSPQRRTIFARRLILSAGALSTPYLLLRNRSAFPDLSPHLGTRFSGNGDFLAFAARSPTPMDPSVGPVITAALRVDDGRGGGHYIEDGGYPDFLAWVGELIAWRRLAWAGRRTALKLAWGRLTRNLDPNLSGEAADLLGSPRLAGGTLPLLGMGREPPTGRMTLRNGRLDVKWSFAEARPYFDHVRSTVQMLSDKLGATLEDSVLWKLSTSVTVHPVGGCPLGANWDEGVVDPSTGQVHGYPGLHVADGSVMPGTVGTNPSFTIAAMADRFADAILAGKAPVP